MAKILSDSVPSNMYLTDCLNLAASAMRKGGRRGGKKQDDEVAIVTCPGCVAIISLFINLKSNVFRFPWVLQ